MVDTGGGSSSRLVDYFAVIGFDDKSERNGVSVGKVIQRFPEVDWLDVPFFPGLELFCQPQGWRVSTKPQPPTFFISVLTDIGADRHYVACLSFSEARFGSENPSLNDDDDCSDDTAPSSTSIQFDSNLKKFSPLDASSRTNPATYDAASYKITGVGGQTQPLPLVYCPKCLVLVSRYPYFEAFRNCLNVIYTVYVDKLSIELELIIGNLVSGVHISPPGGPLTKFSLGAGDRQAVQPPLTATIPVTNSSVAVLFQQLGIYNVICLFSAVLTDKKVLFYSQSYTRLMNACHALSSLIYPLRYTNPYIPLLPGTLVEVLQSPTPFIMGLHIAYKSQLCDVMEVICVDFDNGSVFVPDSITVPPLPEPYQSRLQTCLTLVLNKELYTADYAFVSNSNYNNKTFLSSTPLNAIDKQIRACFLRLFADLFADYRSCLKIVRINPKPFLTFHKAAFLGLRGFQDDDLMNRLIDSMTFQTFVMERGVPFRVCDLFDEVYANMQKILQDEGDDREKTYENIQQVAQLLLNNESPSQQLVNKLPTPSELINPNTSNWITSGITAPFPMLDPHRIQAVIDGNRTKLSQQQQPTSPSSSTGGGWNRAMQLREVPDSPKPTKYLMKAAQISGNVRRLDVLKNCLRCIFENKISDARKMLSAVMLSMKSNVVRVALCQELCSYLHTQNKASIEAQQFDMLVKLMNCALQNDSAMDEYGVAYAMLSLATAYCRRLASTVVQFAYTCVQDHTVWQNQQFWEAAFYHDVHLQLRDLYGHADARKTSATFGVMPSRDAWNLNDEACALKIAAEKIRASSRLSNTELQELAKNEEAIIFSQAIHYANRIVYFRVPMDANKLRRVNIRSLEESSCASASISNVSSVDNGSREGDSTTESDVESGYADGTTAEVGGSGGDFGQNTARWISKFLDKTCSEAGMSADKMRQLQQMIPGVVAMHIETIENVSRESRKLPPIHKPRMLVPSFLSNEQMLQGYLRVYLLPDGRQDSPKLMEKAHDNCLLPAEGAIFMTNYRLIFKGQPCDPYICEKVVIRVIPVMAVTKHKRIGQQYLMGADQTTHYFHDALQIRSATFQMMKIAFDEEVGQEKVQTFCQALEQLRWPESLFDTFALSSTSSVTAGIADKLAQQKSKTGTLKGFAKKTFLKTAQKAGFGKTSKTASIAKTEMTFMTQNIGSPVNAIGGKNQHFGSTTLPSPTRRGTLTVTGGNDAAGFDTDSERSPADDKRGPFNRTLDRLAERSYCKDYQRLGLCTRAEVTLHSGNQTSTPISSGPGITLTRSNEGHFRLSIVNRMYSVCRTYPAVVVVPTKISDDSIKKIAKGHKHSRFPVVTWRSERGALLLRGASFQTRSWNRWKQQSTGQGTDLSSTPYSASSAGMQQRNLQQQTVLKSSIEQERYFNCMVALSPGPPVNLNSPHGLSSSMGSLLSLDSLLLVNVDAMSMCSSYSNTPDIGRKPLSIAGSLGGSGGGQLQKLAAIRNSGGKAMGQRLGLRPGHQKTSTLGSAPRTSSALTMAPRRLSVASEAGLYKSTTSASSPACQTLQRASLYIFGEKNQTKVMKLDPKSEFIPVDYPESHDAKEALKKFLRATAPSAVPTSESGGPSFLKGVDESGWLQLVQSVLQISGAIVDIIDLQNSSVCLCLEYGWDATTQIVSLAQLMLDPYYRTLEGFRTLVEKEWLSYGHRFSHRGNHTLDSSSSGVAPIFLLFLDAVQQIMCQYPGAFEFNDFYLRFVAYQCSASFFRTFLMDCEAERVESGLLQFECKPRPRPEVYSHLLPYEDGSSLSSTSASVTRSRPSASTAGRHSSVVSATSSANLASVWDYIHEKHQRSPRFFNFLYTPGKYTVLRPQFGMSSLNIWDFYTDDPLSIGSAYDMDAAEGELQERQANPSEMHISISSSQSSPPIAPRRMIDLKYDSVDYSQNNIFESTLEKIHNLERDLDVLPQKWPAVLMKLKQRMERDEELETQIGATVEWARWLSRTLHKKATIELLLRGRILSRGGTGLASSSAAGGGGSFGGSGQIRNERLSMLENAHCFQKYNPTAPEHCHVCNRLLWSVVRQGLRCSACELSCHEKCAGMAPSNCVRSSVGRADVGLAGHSRGGQAGMDNRYGGSDSGSTAGTLGGSVGLDDFERYVSSPVETRTYEGYLMKRGALLKAWKQRWFVLDSMKHELRYFDSREDSVCKGRIDLAEVAGIGAAVAPAGTPRHLEGAFFDLKTCRRVYNFMAISQTEAHIWIEKIQASL